MSKKIPEYGVWTRLRGRCLNPKSPDYPDYGGRGITVCARWDSFTSFFEDMGERPSPRHSIDRIDNDGPYAPGNCRWATPDVQRKNNRNTVKLTLGDRTQLLSEWSKEMGIPYETIRSRVKRGLPANQVIGRTD